MTVNKHKRMWREVLFAIVIILIIVSGVMCLKDEIGTALLIWLVGVVLGMIRNCIRVPDEEEGEKEHEEGS